MESLADTIRLRRPHLGLGVINIIDRQEQLVVMSVGSPTILVAPVSQHPKHRQIVGFEKR